MAIEIRVKSILTATICFLLLMNQPVLALSPCDFSPAKSEVQEFNIKGDLQWFDDPFYDDRDSANIGNVEANFSHLVDQELVGYRFDGSGQTQFNFKRIQDFKIWGNGGFKRFVSGDRFILGAADFNAALDVPGTFASFDIPADLDVTAGGGIGRFRDVTVLAKAIRIQNSFLDQGILLGPFTDEKLQQIAEILSEQGVPLADRIQRLEAAIEETGLTSEPNLDAKALLDLERIIESQTEARLCGWEAQASVGLTFNGIPPTYIREAIVLEWNFALVPDPVTQWTGGLRMSTSLALLSDYAIRAHFDLARRLSENLRVRSAVTFTRYPDQRSESFSDRIQFTTNAFYQISNQISATLGLELIGETGYEEISRRVSLQISYDIF